MGAKDPPRPIRAPSTAPAAARYLLAAGANLGLAALFVAAASRRLGWPAPTAANLLTLSRAGAAAMLCGTAFSGRGRRPGLGALLLGCTVCDWLDGPLARRRGPTPIGALLDIEADSWLTLWGAVAACRLGRLPALSLVPPLLRYAVAGGPSGDQRWWQRAAGVAQMVLIAGSLWRWRPSRRVAAAVAAAQLTALAAGARESGLSRIPPRERTSQLESRVVGGIRLRRPARSAWPGRTAPGRRPASC